jgi:hypothetical protein
MLADHDAAVAVIVAVIPAAMPAPVMSVELHAGPTVASVHVIIAVAAVHVIIAVAANAQPNSVALAIVGTPTAMVASAAST